MTNLRNYTLAILLIPMVASTVLHPYSAFGGKTMAAETASKLGDLSAFRAIAVDTALLVDRDDLARAKARIKDLEISWDDAEPSLKPQAAAWHVIDKAIDRALAALRAGSSDTASSEQVFAELLAAINGARPS